MPSETKVYCTHEYTQANLAFALHVEPQNQHLQAYAKQVALLRQQSKITLPSNIQLETEINPFLRCHKQSIQESVAKLAKVSTQESEVRTFANLRQLKDNF